MDPAGLGAVQGAAIVSDFARPGAAGSLPRLAFASVDDPRDISLWSGSPYHMGLALRASRLQLDYIGPLRQRYQLAFKGKQWLHRELLHKRHSRGWEPVITRGYARQVSQALSRLRSDAIFVPGPYMSALADLDCQIPAIVWSDVTFAQFVNYYPPTELGDVGRHGLTDLSKQTVRQTLEGEARVMRKCSLLVFTSQWAASSAIDSYDVDPSKILIAPWGANFSTQPSQREVRQLAEGRRRDQCNLLFMGREWRRKGGPQALEVAEQLNRWGLKTTLTIVGCSPPFELPPFANVVGYVDKGAPGGEETLAGLMEESHFLVLPTTADFTPIAVSEATSRGVPSLARATGAVGEVVVDGRNGKLFSAEADAKEWAAFVLQCFSHWPDYLALAATTFADYEQRLSWNRNGQSVATAVRQLLAMPEHVIGS